MLSWQQLDIFLADTGKSVHAHVHSQTDRMTDRQTHTHTVTHTHTHCNTHTHTHTKHTHTHTHTKHNKAAFFGCTRGLRDKTQFALGRFTLYAVLSP